MLNAANIISAIRILFIPAFMICATRGFWVAALVLFLIASLTDFLDGYVARRFNQVTTLGKFLDPLADKLLIIAAIVVLVRLDVMGVTASMLIITRELAVTSLRTVVMERGVVLAARASGKLKTFSQIVIIAVLLTPYYALELAYGITLGNVLIFIMTAITVYSGAEYFFSVRKLLKDDEK